MLRDGGQDVNREFVCMCIVHRDELNTRVHQGRDKSKIAASVKGSLFFAVVYFIGTGPAFPCILQGSRLRIRANFKGPREVEGVTPKALPVPEPDETKAIEP
jgi:hypothetical protein